MDLHKYIVICENTTQTIECEEIVIGEGYVMFINNLDDGIETVAVINLKHFISAVKENK